MALKPRPDPRDDPATPAPDKGQHPPDLPGPGPVPQQLLPCAQATPSQHEDVRLGRLIEEIFKRNRRRYGYRRIQDELRDHAIPCAASRLRRIMKQQGLRAIQPKNFLPKTSDGRADRPSLNLLANTPLPQVPDQAWAGDITFIPTSKIWLYLAVVIDLGSRRIIGWSLATHMRADLVVHALEQALQARPKARGAIFHSDRGSQYGSSAFRAVLARAGLRQSMSARANPYDNAWTESFIGTLKREMLQGGCFEDATDARLELFEYIESYYNNQRKHSALGYLTPNQFELWLESNLKTNRQNKRHWSRNALHLRGCEAAKRKAR